MALSYSDLEGIWINAGGDPAVASIAAAVALGESSGIPDNQNLHDSNGRGGTQSSWGLWQISDGTHTPFDGWSDPFVNAQHAVDKYTHANNTFSPWGAYTSGRYLDFIINGVPPNMNAGRGGRSPTPGSGMPNAAPPNGRNATPAANVMDPNTWLTPINRLVIDWANYIFFATVILAGLVFMFVGLMMMFSDHDNPGKLAKDFIIPPMEGEQ